MKSMLFLVILTIFTSSIVAAQEKNFITGKVVDETNTPVAYANVGIADTYIGTATNEAGVFSLPLIQAPEDGMLEVSSLGYKTYTARLDLLSTSSDTLLITLQPHLVILDEITISALASDVSHIVQKAVDHYQYNYTQSKYQLKGFYREMIRNDNKYVLLTEAAFTMDDRGYGKDDEKKFRLDGIRKSHDFREMDNLDVHYDTLMESNDLKGIFFHDYIDGRHLKFSIVFMPFFSQNFVTCYDFLLDSASYLNDEMVYCISFFGNRNYFKNFREYNQILIRAKDYAIVEMSVGLKPEKVTETTATKKGNVSRLVDGYSFGFINIKYQEYKGHWYPYLITRQGSLTGGDRQKASRLAYQKVQESGNINDLDFTNAEYNGKKLDPDKNNYYRYSQVFITSIKNSKDKFKRIRNEELMNPDKYVRNNQMPYDPLFWQNFNALLINPYVKAAKKDLEKDNSLEKQFISDQ